LPVNLTMAATVFCAETPVNRLKNKRINRNAVFLTMWKNLLVAKCNSLPLISAL
jgi:hypothetical protein